MTGLNRIQVLGNLGAEPEMRFTPNGNAVTTFSVAVNQSYTGNDGQRQESTEWFRVVAFGNLAEKCNEYLAKGRRAYVEGRLRTNNWTDKDGNKRTSVEIVAINVLFLDRQSVVTNDNNEEPGENLPAEDLPF